MRDVIVVGVEIGSGRGVGEPDANRGQCLFFRPYRLTSPRGAGYSSIRSAAGLLTEWATVRNHRGRSFLFFTSDSLPCYQCRSPGASAGYAPRSARRRSPIALPTPVDPPLTPTKLAIAQTHEESESPTRAAGSRCHYPLLRQESEGHASLQLLDVRGWKSSPSRNVHPSRSASTLPTVDFPDPDTPHHHDHHGPPARKESPSPPVVVLDHGRGRRPPGVPVHPPDRQPVPHGG